MASAVVIGRDTVTLGDVTIPAEARRRSTYVLGLPGSGKSTLLENIAIQDMSNGDGLCFLDPHGDSAEVLRSHVPQSRLYDVAFWHPQDIAHPIYLNPFHCENPYNQLEVDQRAENFLSALSNLAEFAETFKQAPRMVDILRHMAIALVLQDSATLLDAPSFLTRWEVRSQAYPALEQYGYGHIREFWELEFDKLSQASRGEIISSSLNKLRRLTTTTILRKVFERPVPTLNFRSLMDAGKILIVNLHGLGEGNAEVLGALIVWELLSSAYSRGELVGTARRPFHLIADEFQRFASTAFPRIIEEGRKYGIDAIVAHQHRGQLEGEQVRGATKVAPNRIVFQVIGYDAAELAREFKLTPPLPEVTSRRPILTLSQNPWGELRKSGHSNPRVVAAFTRLWDLVYRRDNYYTYPAGSYDARKQNQREFFALDPRIEAIYTSLHWQVRSMFLGLENWSLEEFVRLINRYLLARQDGRDLPDILEKLSREFVITRKRKDAEETAWSRDPAIGEWDVVRIWTQEELDAFNAPMIAIDTFFAEMAHDAIQHLGNLLSQPENHIKTESGQYEDIYGSPISTDEVANRLANELTQLSPFTAKARIGGEEYTFTTYARPAPPSGGYAGAAQVQGDSQVQPHSEPEISGMEPSAVESYSTAPYTSPPVFDDPHTFDDAYIEWLDSPAFRAYLGQFQDLKLPEHWRLPETSVPHAWSSMREILEDGTKSRARTILYQIESDRYRAESEARMQERLLKLVEVVPSYRQVLEQAGMLPTESGEAQTPGKTSALIPSEDGQPARKPEPQRFMGFWEFQQAQKARTAREQATAESAAVVTIAVPLDVMRTADESIPKSLNWIDFEKPLPLHPKAFYIGPLVRQRKAQQTTVVPPLAREAKPSALAANVQTVRPINASQPAPFVDESISKLLNWIGFEKPLPLHLNSFPVAREVRQRKAQQTIVLPPLARETKQSAITANVQASHPSKERQPAPSRHKDTVPPRTSQPKLSEKKDAKPPTMRQPMQAKTSQRPAARSTMKRDEQRPNLPSTSPSYSGDRDADIRVSEDI